MTQLAAGIPDETWEALLEVVDDLDKVRLGFAAYRQGNLAVAERAWSRALESQHPDAMASAAVNLGLLRLESGNPKGAADAFDQAITRHNGGDGSQRSPVAKLELQRAWFGRGLALVELGQYGEARAAFDKLVTTGHQTSLEWRAALKLAQLDRRAGNLHEARWRLETVVAGGHPRLASRAAIQLGLLDQEAGNHAGAQLWYEHAIRIDHPHMVSEASFRLGHVLVRQGAIDDAVAAFQRAADSDDARLAPQAAFQLGLLHERQSDHQAAAAAWRRAVAVDDPVRSATAARKLVSLSGQREDLLLAREALERLGSVRGSPRDALELARVRIRLGELTEARTSLQPLAESADPGVAAEAGREIEVVLGRQLAGGSPDVAGRAGLELGNRRRSRGEHALAREAYEAVVASGAAPHRSQAAYRLGEVCEQLGDQAGAHQAYRQVVQDGPDELRPAAAFRMARASRALGDLPAARSGFQQAAAARDPRVAIPAALALGEVCEQLGDDRGAWTAYRRAVATEGTVPTPAELPWLRAALQRQVRQRNATADVAYAYGSLCRQEGDLRGAAQAYLRVIELRDAELEPVARLELAHTVGGLGYPDAAARQLRHTRSQLVHGDLDPRAAYHLGVRALELGDQAIARSAVRQAVQSVHTALTPTEALHLGQVAERLEDLQTAQSAFVHAQAVGDSDVVEAAGQGLRRVEEAAVIESPETWEPPAAAPPHRISPVDDDFDPF